MKRIFLATALTLSGSLALAQQPLFETSCRVSLIGLASTAALNSNSAEYSTENLQQSEVRVDFGNYTVAGKVETPENQDQKLVIRFVETNHSAQRPVSTLVSPALNFESWQIGETQSLGTSVYGQVQYENAFFVRTDVTCSVTRVH